MSVVALLAVGGLIPGHFHSYPAHIKRILYAVVGIIYYVINRAVSYWRAIRLLGSSAAIAITIAVGPCYGTIA